MSLLRRRHHEGLFRWNPSDETIDLPGEADLYEFLCSPYGGDAANAANCLELPWTAEARKWVDLAAEEMLDVAVEQCCHAERLLPRELRALRLQRFEPDTARRCELLLKELPRNGRDAALAYICWLVRIADLLPGFN